ncbi:unnamed protein product [marine sediment metagenome]|uniref:Methyltransferase FkbM domain-containing protein n=1 Tax=marine sediment metagenome TaxID=412755 RepID=X1FKJ6_9ZZZZ
MNWKNWFDNFVTRVPLRRHLRYRLAKRARETIRNVYRICLKFYRLKILKDPFTIAVNQWFKDDGDSTLRLDYPLTENSIVLDIGGYLGEWSHKISELYNPYILIFESVPEYYSKIVRRFKSNPKASVYSFGLSDRDMVTKMSILRDSSSVYKNEGNCIDIQLKDIARFLKKENIERIDLIKINIEGGEYSLLKRMIDKHIVEKCQDIQVQFHHFYPNAEQLRSEIREFIKKTHILIYDYPFVWENWRKSGVSEFCETE